MENKECNHGKISKIFLINAKDCVIKNGEFKMKRKYGKFKREVFVVDCNKESPK